MHRSIVLPGLLVLFVQQYCYTAVYGGKNLGVYVPRPRSSLLPGSNCNQNHISSERLYDRQKLVADNGILADHLNPHYPGDASTVGSNIPALANAKWLVSETCATLYEPEWKIPVFASYVLKRQPLKVKMNSPRCNVDPRLYNDHRSINEHYTDSGFSRGHIVPAKHMQDPNNDDPYLNTYLCSNIAPQTNTLNNGQWNKIEELTLKRQKIYREIYVLTGTIVDPNGIKFLHDGKNVAIPKKFYKIIIYCYEDKTGTRTVKYDYWICNNTETEHDCVAEEPKRFTLGKNQKVVDIKEEFVPTFPIKYDTVCKSTRTRNTRTENTKTEL